MIEMIKFGAEWCGPCRMVKPLVSALQEKYNVKGSSIKITDIDVDNNGEVAIKYGIKSIPSFVFLYDNELIEKRVGVLAEKEIESILEGLRKIEKVK
jgi:thioredoxin 1